MYKLILSPEHKQILKEAFIDFYRIRQNDWSGFTQDINATNIHDFEEAYSTASPDHKNIYQTIRDENNQIMGIIGFSELTNNIYTLVLDDELIFDDIQDIRKILYVIEEFMRMRIGQFFDFTTDVAHNGWTYDNTNPDNSKKFDEYIERRNKSKEMFETAFKKAVPYMTQKSEKVLLTQDLYDVLKYQIYLDTPSLHNTWTVYSNPPMLHSNSKTIPKIQNTENL